MTRRPRTRPSRTARSLLAAAVGCLVALACSDSDSAPSTPSPSKPAAARPAASEPAAAEAAAQESGEAAPKAEEKAAPTAAELAERGRSVYMANCIACHSQNPAQDGALGPAVAGSSYELIEARVMRAEYPPGYTPKRDSKVMIALPHLANELDALAAYLAEAG